MFREPEQRVYQCDRCSKFFAYELSQADEQHPHDPDARKLVLRKLPAEREQTVMPSAVDLCGNCVIVLERWLVNQ